ncbi:hypothetical protein ACQPZP_33965 [Spirillospora sp. CA-142024]|uniref:hypothetical protein n=1 Tax=Spirillospora sp. CA-142024 TaxID=3240036 RepID=UPI003D938961
MTSFAARKILEDTVDIKNYEWQSDFAKSHIAEGRAKGEAEGKVRALLILLDARGIAVPNDVRERVSNCTDIHQLDRWIRRAAVVNTAEEFLD